MKKFIPDAITLCNLLCGVIAMMCALSDDPDFAYDSLMIAGGFILLGIIFDFFDGLAARLLEVPSELGKQLDSLADLVTSGIAPAMILWKLISGSLWCFVALLIPLFAAYRLAKFNIDERQHTSFRGLPTPANALVWASLGLYSQSAADGLISTNSAFFHLLHHYPAVFGIMALLLCITMVCDLPMISLKFKSYTWKELRPKVIFLLGCLILLILFDTLGVVFCIFYYILFSLIVKPQHD